MKGGRSIRGQRPGAPNGMPLLKPYVYRGSQPYEGPDEAAAGRLRGAVRGRQREFREKHASYWAAREAGATPGEAAERAGVALSTALRNYETRPPSGEIAARGEAG